MILVQFNSESAELCDRSNAILAFIARIEKDHSLVIRIISIYF